MYPILWSIGPFHFIWTFGPFQLHSYSLCMVVALGLSIYLFARDAGRHIAPQLGQTYEQGFQATFDLGIWVVLCSILGARIFYVLENHDQFQNGHWLDAFKVWEGGLVFYGGLFGAILVAILWFQKAQWPVGYSFDLVAPYILLGHAIGRVGCFLNGCCYGNVAELHHGPFDLAHGWVFRGGDDQLPHLPTQLWELIGDLALFFILWYARKWTMRYPWLSLSLYGFTYGILRYIIEFWRRDWDKHYLVFFNSASQAVSGILIVLSAVTILWTIFISGKTRKHPMNQ